jgi:hypothetical protein
VSIGKPRSRRTSRLRISSTCPAARRRGSDSRGSLRVAITTCILVGGQKRRGHLALIAISVSILLQSFYPQLRLNSIEEQTV